jgi:hypothetical protein
VCPGSRLTGARKAAERRRDDGEGGGSWCAGERLAQAKREAKEGVRRGGAPGGFYRAGEGALAPSDGEEWAAA